MVVQQLDMFAPVPVKTRAKYAVLDFETGGTKPETSALCSVAVVRVDENFDEVDSYSTLIIDLPNKIVEREALAINGLTLEEINSKGKEWYYVFEDIKALLAGCIPCGHNVAFDFAFLKNRGYPIETCVCTMELAWKTWPTQKAKLGIVYNRMYGTDFAGAHDALNDVRATIELMKWFNEKNPALLEPAPVNWNRFKR
jgi:DNA polymerase III epsilon subunit-like protein